MFRIFNKKGQNTAEYALLIALVVAGIIAMQTYAQRALQARVRDAGIMMADKTAPIGGGTKQYEPYYLQSNYTVQHESKETKTLVGVKGALESRHAMESSRNREDQGSQQSTYDPTTAATGGTQAMPSGI